jgi:hypothetical protein
MRNRNLLFFLGFLFSCHSSNSDKIIGEWKRLDDSHKNMIVKVTRIDNKYLGEVIYSPVYLFSKGDIKWKDISFRNDTFYDLLDLYKTTSKVEGTYRQTYLKFVDDDEIITRLYSRGNEIVGTNQHWIRFKKNKGEKAADTKKITNNPVFSFDKNMINLIFEKVYQRIYNTPFKKYADVKYEFSSDDNSYTFQEFSKDEPDMESFCNIVISKRIYKGDLNNDGVEDYMVECFHDTGGSAQDILYLIFFSTGNEIKYSTIFTKLDALKKYVRKYQFRSVENGFEDITIANNCINAITGEYKDEDAWCCPSIALKVSLRIVNNKIELISIIKK